MPSTIDLRRRIRSVKNTQQITKAMKMVAAAKLRRAQDRVMAARPYAGALAKVLASVADRVDAANHPVFAEREENRVLLVVVTADKGLSGAFNSNVIRAVPRVIRERGWTDVELVTVGRKGVEGLRRRGYTSRRQLTNVFQIFDLDTAKDIAAPIVELFLEGEFDAVYVLYNRFKSMIAQDLTLSRMLPIERNENRPANLGPDYIYEPGPEEILTTLIPRHIEFQMYRVLLESAAAEQAARMTAMESATKNASDMIQSLTLDYNRIRQAAITKEIIEIVSGAAALS